MGGAAHPFFLLGEIMKFVYVVVKHNQGYDINVAAYTNLQVAIRRLEKEQKDPTNKFFSFWIDTVTIDEE